MFSMVLFIFENDLKQIEYQDSFCILYFVCPIPYVITGEIKYNIDNQICQILLRISFLTIYNVLIVYVIPISLTVFIYFKLVRYVHEISKHVTPINTLFRAQRGLKMVQPIVILFMSFATIDFPYTVFVFISFFTSSPKYHFRIAIMLMNVSLAFVMVDLYKFTEPLKISIKKKLNERINMVAAAIT
jgi:hypothetical protein